MMKANCSALGLILCLCSPDAAVGHDKVRQGDSFHVPLTVQEALPAGVAGLSRTDAPVTLGVPLPESGDFKSEASFGLRGASSGQFRTIARWPNGNIKWLLVDFQSSVQAGKTAEVVLTAGKGNFGGEILAYDAGTGIEVNTGKARFRINRGPFRLFDNVEINGVRLLTPGRAGLMMADRNNKEYRSANDASATVEIEENGPVRAVLKASGSFKDASGLRLADYTVRLHFYRGKSHVKGDIVVRNARKAFPSALYFNSVQAVIPFRLRNSKMITFGRPNGSISRPLQVGETAFLSQGYSTDKFSYVLNGCPAWDPPVPGTCVKNRYDFDKSVAGAEIVVGAEQLNRPGNVDDIVEGWLSLHDSTQSGVTAAMRWMSGYWPAGFTVGSDHTLSIDLYSPRNRKQALKLEFGKHEAREVIWEFDSRPGTQKSTLYHLQYPLVGRAPFEHYRQTRAIYGQSELPTIEEEARYFASHGKPKFAKFANPAFTAVVRAWPWRMGGGGNQIDFPLGDLQDYLRTGFAGFYVRGHHRSLFNAHAAVTYSDDFSLDTDISVTDPNPKQLSVNGPFFDAEHAHMMSLPLHYFMTGDEQVRGAILEYGEHLDRWQLRKFFSIPETQYLRAWSRQYRNLALIYEFTCSTGACNDRYRRYVEDATSALLDSRDDPALGIKSPRGRNLDRGYLYWDTSLTPILGKRVIHSFFHTQIHFEAVWQVLRVMRDISWKYGRRDEIEDYLHGLALFFFEEYYVDMGGGAVTDAGIAYDYPLDSSYQVSSPLVPYTISRPALFAYHRTADSAYLEKAGKLLWRMLEYGNQRYASELQEQALIAAYFRKPDAWRDVEASVTRAGSRYKLILKIPSNSSRIEIRHSSKPIVKWLGFDKVTRQSRYPPNSYTPYFAAQRIEFAQLHGRATQEVTLADLPCGTQCHFAVKYLSQSH